MCLTKHRYLRHYLQIIQAVIIVASTRRRFREKPIIGRAGFRNYLVVFGALMYEQAREVYYKIHARF